VITCEPVLPPSFSQAGRNGVWNVHTHIVHGCDSFVPQLPQEESHLSGYFQRIHVGIANRGIRNP